MEQVSSDTPIASWRHMVTLCAILAGISVAGALAYRGAAGSGGPSGPALYLPLLAAEWGLFLYVRMGVVGHGGSIRGLTSARPLGAGALALDLLLGLALVGAWVAVDYGFDRLLGPGDTAAIQPLLVRRAADIPLWILLSLSAGFVEELTFRGYLQRQFGALLGSRWAGLIAQAILFGAAHGYQGAMPILRITLFGLLFGAAALGRRSLVPGMIAHAAVDVIGGLALLR